MKTEIYLPDFSNPEASSEKLIKDVIPLYMEYWQKYMEPMFHKPFDINIPALINLWLNSTGKLFITRDGEKAKGFAFGILYRPITFNASILHLYDYYTSGDLEVSKVLFKYITESADVLGCQEIWLEPVAHDIQPQLDGPWRMARSIMTAQYTRS